MIEQDIELHVTKVTNLPLPVQQQQQQHQYETWHVKRYVGCYLIIFIWCIACIVLGDLYLFFMLVLATISFLLNQYKKV